MAALSLCAESRAAALVICGQAIDRADAAELLEECGLLDGDPLALPVAWPVDKGPRMRNRP